MTKANEEALESVEDYNSPEMDSKYRMIIVAAKRSKQIQRGARPRIETDPQKHKPITIALAEVQQGKVHFEITGEE